jgi:hypothetical protein
MKLYKEYVFNVTITISIFLFYLLLIYKYDNKVGNFNDMSFMQEDCVRNCKASKVDVMVCLDSCAGNRYEPVSNYNHRPFELLLLSLVIGIIYIRHKESIMIIWENIVYRVGIAKHYKLFVDSDEEMELNRYHKITDI